MYFEKLIVAGNLGADAEVRQLPNGGSVATFSIASTRRYNTKDGEKKEETNWWRCKLYGNAADALSPYLVKGKGVLIEARPEQRTYDREMDLEDSEGETHTVSVPTKTVELNVQTIQLMAGRGDGDDEQPVAKAKPKNGGGTLAAKVKAKPKAAAKAPSMFDDEDEDGEAPF